jgi:DNA-binding Xre family transcriptional regulator
MSIDLSTNIDNSHVFRYHVIRADQPSGERGMTMTLKQHRERAYLSTRELAKKAGVGADTVWRIEGGDFKKLRPSTMRKIADALAVHPSEIEEFTLA